MTTTVLVLGATGMLAKPVVRQFAADGKTVRAGGRDIEKLQRVLPSACECVRADAHDPRSIELAMEGCDAVYINHAPAPSPRKFDPDLEGARIVAKHAAKAGVKRVMRISTMGIPEGAHSWWVAERKQEGDDALRESGVAHTIFQPTWFMESLPLFLLGRRIMLPESPEEMLYWIACEDYAKQVSRAISNEDAANKTYIVQGKYPVSMKHAIIRFIASFDPTFSLLPMPKLLLCAAGLLSAQGRYLQDLLEFTFLHATGFHAQKTFDELGEPSMTIEDYARAIRASGDVPKK